MMRSTHALRAAALAGAAALALAACASSSGTADDETTDSAAESSPLIVGTLLPQTGSLAFLGPPEIAGVDLAIEEINAAGGVLGADVTAEHTDSSDADHAEVATQSATELISKDVSVVIGAASSSVTLNVIDDITGANIVQISPANTATKLSGYSPFYFRTAPPDTVQGAALGNLITGDGHANVGFLVFNDDYGTSLRDVAQGTIEEAGATVTYGAKGAGQEFDPAASSFSTDITALVATKPDAVAVIAFEQTKQIIPELVAAGIPSSAIYLVDGNTADYSADFEAGTLEGAQGTIPGAFPSDEFQERLKGVDPSLTDFAYGPESYDATILAALAAVKGGATDGTTIQANMAAVSGADGGEECSTFADCVALLEDGSDITYKGQAGIGPFNADNDPSSAFIGVYKFGADNKNVWVKAVEGSVG
ncbi:ABC transporter substrate-binding protein [Cellulomonas soli]|uniref:Amino acid ABC transporter substrate-binding protein n=1 Tax=Cellulomonas soli TaxID=931535 RepID=A0A512PAP3_9CELL|nr:ABC transporter substrate-binding protein [Cellulomonas soli]NYI60752.1 branched-chain amino acid transport system substrate-binding protein [Cellulomonas soli]GEP68268.1 amino acid ABC transporter substrate-binding protein [Cellulomonas soli]